MSSNEIISFYLSKLSPISSQFPIESSKLQETHKNALNSILTKFSIPSISFDIKKQINSEYSKIYTKNLEIYKENLTKFLTEKYSSLIKPKINQYKSIDEYKTDIDNFTSSVLNSAPKGPFQEILIYKFI